MKILHLIILLFALFSCANKEKQTKNNFTNLKFFDFPDTLFLGSTNDKCGEWGGDNKTIQIYKQYLNGKTITLLDIIEKKVNCYSIEKNPSKPSKITFNANKIIVDDKKLKLISETIEEFINIKMNFNAENGVSNSGNAIGIRQSNKNKLCMWVYPSPKWKSFDKLFKTLKDSELKK